MRITHPRTHAPFLNVNDPNIEAGHVKIYGKNADALILGDATHEGGDISVYRDTSGNKQLSLDADAASNALALSVYGGVVAQNYLTVGATSLNTSSPFHVTGDIECSGNQHLSGNLYMSGSIGVGVGGMYNRAANQSIIPINIDVSGTDSTDHAIKVRIDANDIIVAQATGDGATGAIDPATKAIGLYGTTPATQHAAIGDPAESIAGNNAAIDSILAALRAIGLIAT